tara:strand:+ start:546 stop:782 length:237 start_codon:yes stop_codon:yes gene_type:complete
MNTNSEWLTALKTARTLGIDKKTLFKYRDDGTLRLGPHYLAFENCFSRDDYKYNIEKVREELRKKNLLPLEVIDSLAA